MNGLLFEEHSMGIPNTLLIYCLVGMLRTHPRYLALLSTIPPCDSSASTLMIQTWCEHGITSIAKVINQLRTLEKWKSIKHWGQKAQKALVIYQM